MRLKPLKLDISTTNRYIAIIDDDTARKLDLHSDDRVTLKNGRHEITAILDISSHTIPEDEIGLFVGAYNALHAKRGDKIKITPTPKPISVNYIREKLDGEKLTPKKIDAIVKDIVKDRLSDVEMAYFVSGAYLNQLSDKETAELTKSIVRNGSQLTFKDKIIVDKHCIGGVPNNRTTMIIVPIMTALGLKMPKTSSRAITSPSGTADTMEILANIKNDAKKLKKIANKVGGFITWGGGVDLAAADDHMIRVRNPLSLDPEGMLLASIMAKKYSVSANRVIIDIPLGPQAKIKNKSRALHLRKRFLKIAKLLGMKAKVIITDGSQPIGNGIGPLLESLDVLKILQNEPDAPQDLRNKALKMAGMLLELAGKAKKGKGFKEAEECLDSGKAWAQMQRIIKAQGANKTPALAKNTSDITAKKSGIIKHINNKALSRISRVAGTPKDHTAGLFLYKKVGDKIKKGGILYRIYAGSKERLKYARKFSAENNGYTIK